MVASVRTPSDGAPPPDVRPHIPSGRPVGPTEDSTPPGGPAMTRIGIILGSTRPHRRGDQVAAWVHDVAARRTDADFELVALRDPPLPPLAEPQPAAHGAYEHEHTRAWSAT